MQNFYEVFDQSSGLKCMKGSDMVIHLKEGAIPYYVTDDHPFADADGIYVKAKIEKLCSSSIMVPVTEPIRVANNTPTSTYRDGVAEIGDGNTFFSSFDAENG